MISESMAIDFDDRDMARVKQLLSHKEALMDCIPGDGNKVIFLLECALNTSNPIGRAITSRESEVITTDFFACISRKLLSWMGVHYLSYEQIHYAT